MAIVWAVIAAVWTACATLAAVYGSWAISALSLTAALAASALVVGYEGVQ